LFLQYVFKFKLYYSVGDLGMFEIILIGVVLLVMFFVVVGVLLAILTYNSLVHLKQKVANAWSQIDVQLKRRADLIPNLIETVSGYAKFEKSVLEEVTKARSAILLAKSPKESAKADNMLSGTLKSLFAVSENYPQLKANENFIALQEELSSTENKISYARQFYNDVVMKWNVAIKKFPNVIFANIFGMNKEEEFFQVVESERENVKVDFSKLTK
jgi:LemA protein